MGVFQKDLVDFSGDFMEGWKKAVSGSKIKQVSALCTATLVYQLAKSYSDIHTIMLVPC